MNKPIFRKRDGENLVFDMVDDYGRTWSRGTGSDRLSAIIDARQKQPPSTIRRGVLLAAKRHPMKAAFLTATAFHTYQAMNAMKRGEDGPGFVGLLIYSAIAYVGFKILTAFVKSDE